MKIELKDLLDENEMLSHIFLECIPREKLQMIKDKYIGEKDWQEESVKLPVEMKIAGVSLNPKQFFDNWKDQMQKIISKEATKLLAKKMESGKILHFIDTMNTMQEVLEDMAREINWDAPNIFNDSVEKE